MYFIRIQVRNKMHIKLIAFLSKQYIHYDEYPFLLEHLFSDISKE